MNITEVPQAKEVNMVGEEIVRAKEAPAETKATRPSSPDLTPKNANEQWNYLFIVGVGDLCTDLAYGGYKEKKPKTEEKITNIIKVVLGTHKLYRTNLAEALSYAIELYESKFLGKLRYAGTIKGLRLAAGILKDLAPQKTETKLL